MHKNILPLKNSRQSAKAKQLESFEDEFTDIQDYIIEMASVCPPQSLYESFNTDFDGDQDLSFYEPRDVKPEKVHDFAMENTSSCSLDNANLLDLTSQIGFKQELSYQDNGQGELLRWTQKHPDHWSTLEVLDWAYYMADYYQLDGSKFRGENYQSLTGSMMSRMTQSDFQRYDPEFGHMFYDLFQQLKSDSKFIEPSPVDYNADPDTSAVFAELLKNSTLEEMDMSEISDQTSKMLDNNLVSMLDVSDGVPKVNIGGTWYDFEVEDDLSRFDIPVTAIAMSENGDHGYGSGDSDVNSELGNDHSRLASVSSDFCSDDESVVFSSPPKKKTVNRKRTFSSTSVDEGCEVEDNKKCSGNRGRKPGQSSKGNHLWEFIRDLLKDTSLNPQLLRWEDKENGVFRFVQSEAVAQMWGRKKNNPGMTYEKLSRAMRFCRSAGYFADVPKNGKFPKKLCFRFGPKASGWQDI